MAIRIGANPIGWSNDDMQEIGGWIPLEQCLSEARAAGFVGMELGLEVLGLLGECGRGTQVEIASRVVERALASQAARALIRWSNVTAAVGAFDEIVETRRNHQRPIAASNTASSRSALRAHV